MAQVVSRLALLMQVLGVTGYDVAMALNIDPSLISKWKRNRRRVPGRSDTMKKIAGYLLEVDSRQDGQNLRPMLESIAGGKLVEANQAVDLLTQWLLDPEPSAWFTDTDEISQVNLHSSSYTCTIEVFRGVGGRRQAVLHFIENIRSLPADQPLLAMMREGTAWLEELPEFHMQYKRGITGWLASGHNMESIHWVDQQPENLLTLIHHWLPMLLDSKINSWYLPVYGKTNLPMTMYIVPGVIALVTCQCSSEPDDYHSIIYTDQATVRQYEHIFNTIKADCLQLVEKFQLQSMAELISRFTESWHQIRNKYISMSSMLPMLISLPQEHLRGICQENGMQPGRIDDLLEQWLAFRRSRDSSSRVRIVHHLGAIEHAAGEADFIDPMLSALAGQPIRVRQKYFRDYLRILCDEIQDNENIELALVRSEIFNRSVWPNLMIISNAFMTAWGNKFFQNRLFSQEATLVHAFELYYSERWQQIPRICRDRQVVVSLLRDLAGDITEQPLVVAVSDE